MKLPLSLYSLITLTIVKLKLCSRFKRYMEVTFPFYQVKKELRHLSTGVSLAILKPDIIWKYFNSLILAVRNQPDAEENWGGSCVWENESRSTPGTGLTFPHLHHSIFTMEGFEALRSPCHCQRKWVEVPGCGCDGPLPHFPRHGPLSQLFSPARGICSVCLLNWLFQKGGPRRKWHSSHGGSPTHVPAFPQ